MFINVYVLFLFLVIMLKHFEESEILESQNSEKIQINVKSISVERKQIMLAIVAPENNMTHVISYLRSYDCS